MPVVSSVWANLLVELVDVDRGLGLSLLDVGVLLELLGGGRHGGGGG